MNSPFHLLIWLAVLSAYCAPAIVAWTRHAPHRGWVTAVNVLLGWTVAGWIVALVMAMRDPRPAV